MCKCEMCGKALSSKRYTLCPSCSHLGNVSHQTYMEAVSVKGHPLYPLYKAVVHHTHLEKDVDTEEMMKYLLDTYSEDELKGKLLMRRDTDRPLSRDNYVLTATRLRGLARKQSKPSVSRYLGVVRKRRKNGTEYWYANFKGKYIQGSCCDTEEEAAALRDNYIIKLGLQDTVRLNFK